MDWQNLQTLWFALIAVLWIGYFFLEGFDFGVGILTKVLARDDVDRRMMINTIGPVWDGNEVWLLTAGGATFAAFPEWYATLFSGFYLPLLLILAALIVRGVAFEFRHHRDDARWHRGWDEVIFWGSLIPAVLWGVAFANIVRGVPIADNQYVGTLLDLLNPYALFAGIGTLVLFTLHGATYLALKVSGDLAERARVLAVRLAQVGAVAVLAFLAWTYANARAAGDTGVVPGIVPLGAVGIAFAVAWLLREHYLGLAFTASGLTIVLLVATLFLNLYPRVMVSSLGPEESMTIFTASSTDTTLLLMTVAALVMTPVVIAYQAWTYWVFRHRIDRSSITAPTQTPMDVIERLAKRTGRSAPPATGDTA
jgi:cytochrome d ubiquinol oxidase subunit II